MCASLCRRSLSSGSLSVRRASSMTRVIFSICSSMSPSPAPTAKSSSTSQPRTLSSRLPTCSLPGTRRPRTRCRGRCFSSGKTPSCSASSGVKSLRPGSSTGRHTTLWRPSTLCTVL
eukprot:Amastigsp_a340822_147.p6 type:complete len:117 gc:universal Amastigsp_a340822_147:875-1225(+)